MFGSAISLLLPIVFAFAFVGPATASTAFVSPEFAAQWQQGEALLPNFWGPLATAKDGQVEPYAEGTAAAMQGQRLVQYFDKARMEQTTPGGSVSNGLLTVELLSGRVQKGDTIFEQREAADVPVAGDPDNAFPTYADLQNVTPRANQDNAPVTLLI